MAKRQKLTYDEQTLTEQLKASSGQGVDAFFPSEQPSLDQEKEGLSDASTGMPDDLPTPESDNAQSGGQPYGRTHDRPFGQPGEHPTDWPAPQFWSLPTIPGKRKPERYAFQFWADQIARLKKLNQLLNLQADPDESAALTLSDMAREAFDAYLEKQAGKLPGNHTPEPPEPNDRTGVRTAVHMDERTDERLHKPNES